MFDAKFIKVNLPNNKWLGLNMKKILLTFLIIGFTLTVLSPLCFDRSVQSYFPSDHEKYNEYHNKYKWQIYGGWFQAIRTHLP